MNTNVEIDVIQSKIFDVRGQRVMLDYHLAELYEVQTKVLKQAVKRNIERFPEDFMFVLSEYEFSQLVTNCDRFPEALKHSSVLPMVFTEHGVAMLSSVLRSQRAIDMNIAIIRAFVALRQMAIGYEELKRRIDELELSTNSQFSKLYKVLTRLFEQKAKPRKTIGYVTTDKEE